jgi:hypothetical protein
VSDQLRYCIDQRRRLGKLEMLLSRDHKSLDCKPGKQRWFPCLATTEGLYPGRTCLDCTWCMVLLEPSRHRRSLLRKECTTSPMHRCSNQNRMICMMSNLNCIDLPRKECTPLPLQRCIDLHCNSRMVLLDPCRHLACLQCKECMTTRFEQKLYPGCMYLSGTLHTVLTMKVLTIHCHHRACLQRRECT